MQRHIALRFDEWCTAETTREGHHLEAPVAESFGALLRELRLAAGLSMSGLAARINYSKSYLSKIENDLKPPNPTVARLCDSALDAGGALIAMVQPSRTSAAAPEVTGEEVWVM